MQMFAYVHHLGGSSILTEELRRTKRKERERELWAAG